MITLKEKTTIAAISELRNKSEEILRELKDHHVVLQKHHKPVAVLFNYKNYEAFEEMLEFAEDYVLGSIALARDKRSKKQDFVELDQW